MLTHEHLHVLITEARPAHMLAQLNVVFMVLLHIQHCLQLFCLVLMDCALSDMFVTACL